MTSDPTAAGLATIADALSHMQGQLDELTRASSLSETRQREILRRLEVVDNGQRVIAQVAAFAHAASIGNGAALPTDVVDDPVLEAFLIAQPADRTSTTRALVEWRRVARTIGSAELTSLLVRQYHPSPTDTPDTRRLRYQMAAIGREELRGRGVALPSPPPSTVAQDCSREAALARSAELAQLWRAGESAALYAEPELAGALDIFEAAERLGHGVRDEQLSVEFAELHRALGDRVAAGERPTANEQPFDRHKVNAALIDVEKPR